MSTTIRLRHLTKRDFDTFFQRDSPAYYSAKEAFWAGEAKTAVEALEILCLANKQAQRPNGIARFHMLPLGRMAFRIPGNPQVSRSVCAMKERP